MSKKYDDGEAKKLASFIAFNVSRQPGYIVSLLARLLVKKRMNMFACQGRRQKEPNVLFAKVSYISRKRRVFNLS